MRHGYYLMHGPCIYSGTSKMTMENPRTKAKHGRGEGRRRMDKTGLARIIRTPDTSPTYL